MTKILNLSLVALLVFQLLIAACFELSHDEAYYWLYSNHLDWGFFDHPPMVGLIIKFFGFLPKSEISVRFGFILLQLTAAYLLMKEASKEKRWIALALFFSFPLASFSGLLALPDLPLLFMTTLYCLCLKRFLEKSDALSIMGLSAIIPMLLYSKYHGILVIFFTLVALPKLFKRKEFYLICLVSILLFLPHVIWQYQHEFSTLKYHFFERPKSDFSVKRLFEYSLTQVFLAGLFAGPVVWWSVLKSKNENDFDKALKFISVGTFFFFLVSTISKKFEANWTIFLTAPLILLSLKSTVWDKKWAKKLLIGSVAIVLAARILFIFDPSVIKIKRLGEFHGWEKWAQDINEKCQHPIMANTYQLASKLSFYLNRPIHALNFHSRKNQFDYWERNPNYYPTSTVCYITDKKQFQGVEVVTPEGKNLILVPELDLSEPLPDSP